MSDEDARRRELEERNAGLRDRIDNMLSDLHRRTEDLQRMQDEAAQRTHEVSSEDGLVTVTVDASGTVQQLDLAPKTFERTSPEKLARTITSVIREASGGAQQALQSDFEPMTRDMPDLTEFVPQGPSLQGLLNSGPLVQPPDPQAERAKRTGDTPPPSNASRARPTAGHDEDFDDDFDDEPPQSFMKGGRW